MLQLKTLTGLMTLTTVTTFAFAEPQIQPGDTLESLSQVKIETFVNGQAGSLEQMGISKEIIAQAVSQNVVIDLQTQSLQPLSQYQTVPSALTVSADGAQTASVPNTSTYTSTAGVQDAVESQADQVNAVQQNVEQGMSQTQQNLNAAVNEVDRNIVESDHNLAVQATEATAQLSADEAAAVEATLDTIDPNAQALPANSELPEPSIQLNEDDSSTVTPLQ